MDKCGILALVAFAGSVAGVGGILLFQTLWKKLSMKKESASKIRNMEKTLTSSESETDSSSVEDPIISIKNIPVPNLLTHPVTEQTQKVFGVLRSMFPQSTCIVPLRYCFPLNNETLMLLACSYEITEPMTTGHPQSVYNTLSYPLKLVLDSPLVDFFGFEVVHGGVKDAFSLWKKGSYALNNLKAKRNTALSSPIYSTHIVPLFVAHDPQRIQNVYFVKKLLVNQFTLSERCLNAPSTSSSSSFTSSSSSLTSSSSSSFSSSSISSSSFSSSSQSAVSSVKVPVVLLAYFRIGDKGRM